MLVLGAGEPAAALDAFEGRVAAGLRTTVVSADEPELHLRPQAQRWFARLLHRAAEQGNQVVYGTRSPAFLNVARLHELVYVERRTPGGTTALRPPTLTADEDFRVLSEFDAERAELLLARAALLVEGETEKLALPFVFAALGRPRKRRHACSGLRRPPASRRPRAASCGQPASRLSWPARQVSSLPPSTTICEPVM
jgi:hypothetical protein